MSDLDKVLDTIRKDHGEGSVMRMDENFGMNVERFSSGSMTLDAALGGGYPRGRIIEIYGPESAGKSTLCLHAVAEAQKAGGVVAYIDSEHALDPVYAEALGVDVSSLIVSQPDFGEQALEIADQLVRSGEVALVVVDSVAALTPRAEMEGEMGDAHVGRLARLMAQAMRKMTSHLNQTKTTIIFVNQIREKIGVLFGSPETQPGGRALKFHSSQRLDIRRIESVKDGADIVANRVRVKVVKNKVSRPFQQAEFDIEFGVGINRTAELVDLGADLGIVTKKGAWYSLDGDNIGQGKAAAIEWLKDHPIEADKVREMIVEEIG